jgi:hypothetical protein
MQPIDRLMLTNIARSRKEIPCRRGQTAFCGKL